MDDEIMMRKRSCILWALTPVLLLPACKQEVPAPNLIRPVRAATVADAEGLSGRSFPGRAKATEETNLSFRVAGPLIARPVNVGSNVVEGDIVARIDPRDFEVNLRNVQGQLEKANSRRDYAEKEYERAQRIRFDGCVYREDIGRA